MLLNTCLKITLLRKKQFCKLLKPVSSLFTVNGKSYSYGKNEFYKKPYTKIAGKYVVTMAKGGGIGAELMEYVKEVLTAGNCPIIFEEIKIGPEADESDLENFILSVRRNGVALQGNIERKFTPVVEFPRAMQVRRRLDLYANLVEIKSYAGLRNKNKFVENLYMVLIRQNTEGEFSMLEHNTGYGVEHLKITTKNNCERLARFGFEYALKNHLRRVITVYNKMLVNKSEAMFMETSRRLALEFLPLVEHKLTPINSFVADLQKAKNNNCVVLTTALNGDLIRSIMFGFIGTSGMHASQNVGDLYAVFETAGRNKLNKLVNQNTVNPVGMLMAATEVLKYLGKGKCASNIRRAVEKTIKEGIVTKDVGGNASTSQMIEAIISKVERIV